MRTSSLGQVKNKSIFLDHLSLVGYGAGHSPESNKSVPLSMELVVNSLADAL